MLRVRVCVWMWLLSSAIPKSFVVASQRVSKFRDSADKANVVQIYLAVVRLRHVGTDLIVSYNVPVAFGPGSSSGDSTLLMNSTENIAVVEGVLATLKV